jgi:hypothetical protein
MLKRENVALKAVFDMNKGVSIIACSESMLKIMEIIEGRGFDSHASRPVKTASERHSLHGSSISRA